MDTPCWSLAHLDSVLAAMGGPGAVARPDQATAVEALVEQRRRVLVVQATGWGKSAVYWAATSALRAQGAGPTIVISPLLALMRDQIAAASAAGLRAATVNSTNVDDWQQVFDALAADSLDLLLVSPERLANPRFERVALPLLARAGLLVIDEAHCISDWGFDFRPDYQRISGLLLRLAPQTPVLATTATANARVTADVARQLGPDTLTLRGPLARSSLRLSVVPGLDGVARAAWVSQALPGLPGSGIVYCLTVDAAHSLAEFLAAQGHAVAAYTGRTPADERERIEERLKANALKAVVATSALGMGYDKPDLGFCIHVGSPDSPIAYYQQVGRAGRALDSAAGILLPAAEVEAGIWEYFAKAAIPDSRAADRLLAALAEAAGPMTAPALESACGLRRGRLEALLKTLRVDGAVDRQADGWVATGRPWSYDADKYASVVEALPAPGPRPGQPAIDAARAHLRGRDVVVEPRKLWPAGAAGRRGRISGAAEGRAVCFAQDAAWPELVAELSGPDAPASPALRQALVDVLARFAPSWAERPVAVVAMPGSRAARSRTMAEHVAAAGRLPLVGCLAAAALPAEQREVSAGARVDALDAALQVAEPPPAGPLLLVADTARTRWALTVAAARLREAGATAVIPLVGHLLP